MNYTDTKRFKKLAAEYLKNDDAMYKEKEIEKIYFTVGEVAEMLNVNRSLIRFWEGEFEELNPGRRRNKFREFTKEDVEMVKKIYRLLKVERYTLEGTKRQLKLKNNGALERS